MKAEEFDQRFDRGEDVTSGRLPWSVTVTDASAPAGTRTPPAPDVAETSPVNDTLADARM